MTQTTLGRDESGWSSFRLADLAYKEWNLELGDAFAAQVTGGLNKLRVLRRRAVAWGTLAEGYALESAQLRERIAMSDVFMVPASDADLVAFLLRSIDLPSEPYIEVVRAQQAAKATRGVTFWKDPLSMEALVKARDGAKVSGLPNDVWTLGSVGLRVWLTLDPKRPINFDEATAEARFRWASAGNVDLLVDGLPEASGFGRV